jgi:hypothetical protein
MQQHHDGYSRRDRSLHQFTNESLTSTSQVFGQGATQQAPLPLRSLKHQQVEQ